MSPSNAAKNAPLAGRAALVTGAAKRVGREIVLELARAGMDVAFTYNASAAEADSLAEEVEALGRNVLAIRADFSRAEAPPAVVEAVRSGFGRLHALVNNASSFDPSPLGTVSVEQMDRDFAVNARAPMMLIQSFTDMLRADYRKDDPASMGRIVNFIDIHVLGEPLRGYLSYNASKAALMEITATTALELAPAITVNAIAPGVVQWAPKDDPATQVEYLKRVPLARPGTPVDAATAVLYLVRDAHYCTGQTIRLDGGRTLT